MLFHTRTVIFFDNFLCVNILFDNLYLSFLFNHHVNKQSLYSSNTAVKFDILLIKVSNNKFYNREIS